MSSTRKLAATLVVVLMVLMIGGVAFMQRARRTHSPATVDGSIIKLDRNGDFQSAINAAKPGDTIVLEAGATYNGPFTLPFKPGNEYITIQTSRITELPEGVRVSPAQSALFAKLQSAENGAPIVKTEPRSHHYKFIGIEFSTAHEKVQVNDLVRLGANEAQTTLDVVPHHLVIDRSYIHGFQKQEVQRGISLNSAETSITNSYISEIHGKGYDTQAICSWNGPGRFKIINNYLEGAGENVMFGGALPAIPNLTITDIEFRRNHVVKPFSWRGVWSVKNLFELKNARNVIVDGNIFDGNWTDAQAGRAIVFTPRPSDSGLGAVVEDVTFSNNIIRNVGSGLLLLGIDEPPAPINVRLRRVKVVNNVFEIDGPKFGSNGVFLTIINGTEDVTVEHNTAVQTGNIISTDYAPNNRFIYRNNITRHNEYGIFGSGLGIGKRSIAHYLPGSIISGNVMAKEVNAPSHVESLYPAGNFFPQSMQEVGFVDYDRGNYRLRPGSRFRSAATDGTDPGADFDKLPKLNFDK